MKTWLYFFRNENKEMEFLGTHTFDKEGLPPLVLRAEKTPTIQDVQFPENMLLGETLSCYVLTEDNGAEFIALTGQGVSKTE